MYATLRTLAWYALWASTALAAVPAQKYTRCGTEAPAPELLAAAQSMRVDPEAYAAAATLNVNTYFHVVTTAAKQGSVTQTQLNDQLAYMNRSYGPSGIAFTLISSDFTVNDRWATGNYDTEMKPKLRKGTYQDLNVYFLSDLGGGLLGICNFPQNVSPGTANFYRDGCNVLAQSVPGGTVANYNLGGTATHEIGHWFGLFHVFQGSSCNGQGDSVGDTPLQSTPTNGCPASKDSCPRAAGLDSIHNYMDYSYDVCYTQFTPAQATRAKQMFAMYRAGK
ncbi:MAG: hypothetical protein LQ345_006899 [Seirophora villosa]|nr:MAG: hypothetical protein LQ345_006899 [Seirophora villosa]